jgi:hypothetical protein
MELQMSHKGAKARTRGQGGEGTPLVNAFFNLYRLYLASAAAFYDISVK